MLRNKCAISKVYGLSKPYYKWRHSVDEIITFLAGYDHLGYLTVPNHDCSTLHWIADHVDYFQNEITFLPYLPIEEVKDKVKNDRVWQIAQECGIKVTVAPTQKCIFDPHPYFENCEAIIILSRGNLTWHTIRNNICKYIHELWWDPNQHQFGKLKVNPSSKL